MTTEPIPDALIVGALILAALACIGAAGGIWIAHRPFADDNRRHHTNIGPDPEPPHWVNEGDPPRVTPDRRHRPRHDWREDCRR